MIAFGPIPSRRLGRSLGLNNIPPKVCTYSCVYCQAGRTTRMRVERQPFYDPEEIAQAVREKVERTRAAGESIDYLTFVPDGEPTLDVNLGREIECLTPLDIKTAVITNSSLIWRQDVRADLVKADLVSFGLDGALEEPWHRVNRPHGTLRLDDVLDGLLAFSDGFEGELITETMLVRDVNDGVENVSAIADFLARLKPDRVYLAIPTRPPAEHWARPPDEDVINRAYQILSERLDQVEYLIGYEGTAFSSTGDVAEDLLGITAVHPMRADAVRDLFARAGADWSVVEELVEQERLVRTRHDGRTFYLRKLPGRRE
jgi:wyosine [tRNA(Phe)-imidazoG37] synthetase (radical SAM superfamily)